MAENTTVARRDLLEGMLKQAVPKMMAVLPPSTSIVPEKIVRMALLDVSQSQYLRECDPMSIVTSVMHAAALGLNVGPFLGEAYLVPFKGRCQLIPGYKGLVKLAMQGLSLSAINARLVYKDDYFRVFYGTEARIEHEPKLDGSRADEDVVAAYTVAKLRTGDVTFNVMTRAEIEKRRDVSASKNSKDSPWVKWFPEQCLKTVVRAGVKLLPASADTEAFERLNAGIELENRFDLGRMTAVNAKLDNEQSLSRELADRTADQAGDLRDRVRSAGQTAKAITGGNAIGDPDLEAELERQRVMDEEGRDANHEANEARAKEKGL